MSDFVTTLAAETLRMSVPYATAAIGGALSEKSGVVNIALEGILLASGFAAATTAILGGSAVLGLACGIATGALLGLVHGVLAARFRVDAIVSGVALNLAAAGGTRFLLRAFFASSSNSPKIPALVSHVASSPLVRTLTDPMVLLAAFALAGAQLLLTRTRFGLNLRASGEDPTAARVVGVPVVETRVLAVVLGGAICALGGISLAYDQHQFQSGMSGGRGFIALAAVIVSRWRPPIAVLACLAFAALDALGVMLQNTTKLPPDLLAALPFVATLASLAIVRGKGSGAPAGLAKHAD
jgi:simple sugar transport system permease protein